MRDKDSEIDRGDLSHRPLTHGDRVCAVWYTDDDGRTHVFGYGTFDGVAPIGREAGGPVSALARVEGQLVPRVVLDDGRVVWGTECHIAREEELKVLAKETDTVIVNDIDELRVKVPKFLVVKFFVPPRRQLKNLPIPVCNETFRQMEILESIECGLHLEGEYLSGPQRFTVTMSDSKEDLDIEIVSSMGEQYRQAVIRIIERAHQRFIASA